MTRKTTLLTLIFLLALAIAIPAASALSITAPGTYTLSGDQTTLTITGTTGTYTINGAGHSVTGSTTITAPAGQTLTVIINDANLQAITGYGGNTAGSNGANGGYYQDGGDGGDGSDGGSIKLTLNNCTSGQIMITGGNGGIGGNGGKGGNSQYADSRAGFGGDGGDGGDGGNVEVTLLSSHVMGLLIITSGSGGDGGAGGVGGTGWTGSTGAALGKDGGNGGNGGNGGSIKITLTNSNIQSQIVSSSGSGGDGGGGGGGGGSRGTVTNGGTGGTGGSGTTSNLQLSNCITGPITISFGNYARSGTNGSQSSGTSAGASGTTGGGATTGTINALSGSIANCKISASSGHTITINSKPGVSGYISSITGSTLTNTLSTGYLLYYGQNPGSNIGRIANNILSTARSDGQALNYPSAYTFYQTPASGTNIVGGTQIGGNYWTNPTHTGYSDGYSISAGYIGTTFAPAYNNDQYPLIKSLNLGQLNQTPAPTTQKTPDIGGTTSNTSYNVIQQYTLTTSPLDIHYTGATDAIVPAANAVYILYGNNQTLTPTTATTGTTLTQTYITKNHTLAANTNGQIIIYPNTPGTQEPQIIAQTDQQITALALSPTLITYTINNAKTYILDRTTNKYLAIYTTTAATTYAAANQQTDTITIFTGTTFTICHKGDDGTLDTQTFSPVSSPNGKITGIWENYDTNTILITTTTSGTYLYTTTSTGTTVTATQTSKSTETNPLTNIHNTQANTYIASNNNELYIIDAAGTTVGTYTAGAQIEATGIARLTGLYGYASGQDTQLYVLSKTGTSDWYLQQTMQIFRPVTGGDMATTGYYILISVDQDLYLISLGSAVNPPSGNDQIIYYLNGIVINTNGAPYVGQITIGDNTLTTDSTGKFVVIVEPGTTYTITAGTTTTQYTATNVQYQTVAIKIQPDPYATNIDYTANWNSTTQAIDMTYTDKTGRTNSVTWKIRNTATNDIVYQQTTTSGQTLSYPLPAEQQYTNYQISMTADRTTTSGTQTGVSNTWMITPSGSNPIALPLDDTGKNILFTGVLMVFAALFGVMYSTKGAIAITALAAMMRYLELITIPWIVIVVAMVISILAALAKGSGGR